MKKEFNIKCPKCGCRRIWLTEVIEAGSQHFINDGVWDKSYDNNEYGNGIRVDLTCDECGHHWTGRKGVTIDCYRINYRKYKAYKPMNELLGTLLDK